jgi:outer membrane biogenesis lipoprotein LolB
VRTDAAPGQPARAVSGQFELSGNASSGQLLLTSPIGTTVARARWSDPQGTQGVPSSIELEADGATTHYATLEDMMQRAIGDQLPLPAMFDWLAGRPWPAAPVQARADGGSFDQLGWHVDLSQFAGNQLIDAQRAQPAPALHVRVKLDAAEPISVGRPESPKAMAVQAFYDLPAPAKLNLFLHVTGRRADGYHLLQSVFILIDWADTLHVERRGDGQLRRHDLGPALPADDLSLRAARALQQASGCTFGADISVQKNVPWGAGMGGGSSDAATVLLALNRSVD